MYLDSLQGNSKKYRTVYTVEQSHRNHETKSVLDLLKKREINKFLLSLFNK